MSKSYIEVKEEKEQKIALNISIIEFEKKANVPEAIKEEYCVAQEKKEIKDKPEKIKEEKKEQKVVEKKVKEEIRQEDKIESVQEVKSEEMSHERAPAQIKQVNNTPNQEQKIAPSEVIKQPTPQEEYSEINKQKILELLRENLYYPMSARKRNITGEVKISFTLDTNAKACNIRVVESLSDVLSRAAVQTIEELSGKFPKPKTEITLTIPISYNLH